MLAQLFQKFIPTAPDLIVSTLYNENNFYDGFLVDLGKCKYEVIIERPRILVSSIFSNNLAATG